MGFKFEETRIEGVKIIVPDRFYDERGYFEELYNKEAFAANGITEEFVQDNHSVSQKGVIRGIHFQKNPKAQGKLVYVLRGIVVDFAVDLRPESPTFRNFVEVELNAKNGKMLYIPQGLGHAFISLTNNTHFCYKCTAQYSKEHECGVNYLDQSIRIKWSKYNNNEFVVSDKDKKLPMLWEAEI